MNMIGGSFLSFLPQGLFTFAVDGGVCGQMSMVLTNDKVRKRRRDVGAGRTPRLVSCGTVRENENNNEEQDGESDRPRKRLRGQSKIGSFLSSTQCAALCPGNKPQKNKNKQTSDLIKKIPCDVVAHCLSFLGSTKDRYALQNTCKLFRKLSSSDSMLSNVDVFGELETGKGGIIQEKDTPASASSSLAPFARAGNLQALYMLGVVKCYCYQDLKNGILMLKMASSRGFVRSSYTLGIILRDALPEDASNFMNTAASKGFFPALQEILSAREMKDRFGEPNADELRRHLDSVGLNRLLLRDYVNSAELRGMNTSHCWNPLCGKWAYKASSVSANSDPSLRMRSPNGLTAPTYDVDEHMLDPPSQNEVTVSPSSLVGNHEDTDATVANDFDIANDAINPFHDTNRLHRRVHPYKFSKGYRGSSSRKVAQTLAWNANGVVVDRVARMKMCSRCCRAKYCSKLCQVYDWRSSQHKMECQFL